MYKEEPEFVTHCPRGHPRKFQVVGLLTETDMHNMAYYTTSVSEKKVANPLFRQETRRPTFGTARLPYRILRCSVYHWRFS